MIPLRANIYLYRYPLFTNLLILGNTIAFIYELFLGEELGQFIFRHGLVPGRIFLFGEVPEHLEGGIAPLFTSMFLHAGWFHFLGNMLFLSVFGKGVEDRLGYKRFLFLYFASGVIAACFHIMVSPSSMVPLVGASGAIAGVLGAYLLMFPLARVKTIIPPFFFFGTFEIPAIVFLGIWFLMQFLNGTSALAFEGSGGGVAWWAHIGGFVGGIFILYSSRKKGPSH
jgi:membrane associated rhomboid family serine protease